MMYGSWNIDCNKQNFLSFWTVFYLFNPITTWKIKFWKNEKTAWRYYHFIHVYHKWQSNDVWFLRYEARQTIFLSFWTIFCPFTPLTARKIKISKKWNIYLEMSSFYTSVPKIMIIWYTVPETLHVRYVMIFCFGLLFAP